jgi:adenosine kinase
MPARTQTILVSGSLAFDLLLRYDGSFVDSLDPAGMEHLSVCYYTPTYARLFGGNGGAVAWTLALLGENARLLSTVGSDGGDYVDFLADGGVDASGIERLDDCQTATCIIGSDSKGRQISFWHEGANGRHAWRNPPPDVSSASRFAIALPMQAGPMLDMLRWCKAHDIRCFFDPGQRMTQLTTEELREAMELSSGMFMNSYEAELLASRLGTTIEKIAKDLPFLVVTRDASGFMLYEKGRSVGLPRCDADKVANPTGAGDAFRAGFITGLNHGWTLEQCGQLGAAVASKCVEQPGVIIPSLDIDRVYDRAEKAYGRRLPTLS